MKRTKERPIGALLEEFFSRPYIASKLAEGRLPQTWRQVVGDRVADISRLKFENRVLTAHISSGVVRSELFYRREYLLEEINRISGMRLVNVLLIK